MTLLKCNYLIFTNLFSVIFIHIVVNCCKIALIHTFFNNQSLFSLFLVDSKSMLALLPFKDDNSKTFEWQVFSHGWWGLDLSILHSRITSHISNSWCATRNPVPDSTYHLADLKSVTTESQNVGPCMTATPWRRVNWKMCDENSTFACFDAICTQFNVTWPHCGTVRDFFGSLNWTWLPSWIGFFTARWQWQPVRAARARSSKQNTRANISVFCLQTWPSIKSRAINGFNKCVFGFYSHRKVWYKSEKAFGMCSEWHYTTRGLAYEDMTTRPTGSLSCLHPPISLVV